MKHEVQRKPGERGFALLLVFLMASVIALFLYRQAPRAAFEAQRDKEQLLIERGEQYKLAVQRYFVKYRKFPQDVKELENTNSLRFLRRRYTDPLTGKDEWRLIHVNAAGVLTDSKVQPFQDPLKSGSGKTDTTQQTTAASDSGVNQAAMFRPSDRTLPTAQSFGQQAPPQPIDPNQPQPGVFQPGLQQPGQPGVQQPYPGQPGFPGQPNVFPGQPGYQQPGLQQPGFQPPGQPGFQQPGFTQPGQPGFQQPGQPGFQQPGFQQPGFQQPGFQQPGLQQPGMQRPGFQPGMQQPGFNSPGFGPPGLGQQQSGLPTQTQSQGVNMINSLLTTPRQPPAGLFNNNQGGQFGAGGLAGVASKFEGKGIKVYNERSKYEEWEFVFDMKNDPRMQQQMQQFQGANPLGGQAVPGGQGNRPGGQNPGGPGSGFGGPGFGNPGQGNPGQGNPNRPGSPGGGGGFPRRP